MANIVRRNEPKTVARPSGTEWPWQWEPFRAMRDLMRWDPFQEIESAIAREHMFVPRFDVTENNNNYVLRADLPGVKESDVEISLSGNQLQISGKRSEEREEESERTHISERSYGSFTRSFTLPEGCDSEHVNAELRDGVLTLTLPKKPEVQPKKITITAKSEQGAKGKA